MDLDAYLSRIGYEGPIAPTLAALREVHRRHALSIAYENLDVFLGRRVDQDIARIHRKIVRSGRGGWCYEMNGLLGWALTRMGFTVTRMCGGVMRAQRGDEALGNHLVLRVDLEEGAFIADVGLGDGILEPLALSEGEIAQHGREFRLERLGTDEWRFHNRKGGLPPTFDFFDRAADEARLASTCSHLQSDPDSIFRENLICQRLTPEGVFLLLGRQLHEPHGTRRLLDSEAELTDVLVGAFGIVVPDLTGLWNKVSARHETLFGSAEGALLPIETL